MTCARLVARRGGNAEYVALVELHPLMAQLPDIHANYYTPTIGHTCSQRRTAQPHSKDRSSAISRAGCQPQRCQQSAAAANSNRYSHHLAHRQTPWAAVLPAAPADSIESEPHDGDTTGSASSGSIDARPSGPEPGNAYGPDVLKPLLDAFKFQNQQQEHGSAVLARDNKTDGQGTKMCELCNELPAIKRQPEDPSDVFRGSSKRRALGSPCPPRWRREQNMATVYAAADADDADIDMNEAAVAAAVAAAAPYAAAAAFTAAVPADPAAAAARAGVADMAWAADTLLSSPAEDPSQTGGQCHLPQWWWGK